MAVVFRSIRVNESVYTYSTTDLREKVYLFKQGLKIYRGETITFHEEGSNG